MTKQLIKILPLIFLIVACAPELTQAVPSQPVATMTLSPLSIPTTQIPPEKTLVVSTLSPSVTQIPRPLVDMTLSPTSTEGIITPDIVKICPEPQEVSFEELDLDPGFRLLLRELSSADDDTRWMVSATEPTPQEIPATRAKEGWTFTGAGASPSGKWLILYYHNEEETQETIWLSSLDGQKQWEVVTIDIGKRAYFISDEELIIVGVPLEYQAEGRLPWDEFIPEISLNPFTGETKELLPLPERAIFDFYFTYEGHSYAVYYVYKGGNVEVDPYFLFNYTDRTSTRVFQWLSDADKGWHYLSAGVHQRDNGLFSTTFDRSYGFDFAVDIPFEDIFHKSALGKFIRQIRKSAYLCPGKGRQRMGDTNKRMVSAHSPQGFADQPRACPERSEGVQRRATLG